MFKHINTIPMSESESDSWQITSTQLELLLVHRKNPTSVQSLSACRHQWRDAPLSQSLSHLKLSPTVPLTWMGSNVLHSHQVSIQKTPPPFPVVEQEGGAVDVTPSPAQLSSRTKHFFKDSRPLLTIRLADGRQFWSSAFYFKIRQPNY